MNITGSKVLSDTVLRNVLVFILALMVGSMIACKEVNGADLQQMQQIKQKAQQAKKDVIARKRSGGDVSELLELMSQVKPAMDSQNFDEAESLLDEVLNQLESEPDVAKSSRSISANTTREYGSPEVVNIEGYSEDAMEPFVSRDGKYLFFNNLNDPEVNTNLYYAEKIDELNYQYKGAVEGTNSRALDAVPTLDNNGQFCFVSTREFKSTRLTLFCGNFENGKVTGLKAIGKSMVNKNGFRLNMGPELSPDGKTLYYVENVLDTKKGMPKSLNIKVATFKNGEFNTDSNSDEIMKNINTDALEYAPAISDDGLELSFTRASELIVGNRSSGKDLRILIAKRKALDEPFGIPMEINTISGFVEGSTVIDNGNIMYFHKRDGARFKIFRVTRSN